MTTLEPVDFDARDNRRARARKILRVLGQPLNAPTVDKLEECLRVYAELDRAATLTSSDGNCLSI